MVWSSSSGRRRRGEREGGGVCEVRGDEEVMMAGSWLWVSYSRVGGRKFVRCSIQIGMQVFDVNRFKRERLVLPR